MQTKELFSKTTAIFMDFTYPECIPARKLSTYAEKYQKTFMAITILAGSILGLFKPFTFLMGTLSAIALLPFISIYKAIRYKSLAEFLPYLMSWLMSILVLALIIGSIAMVILCEIQPEVVFFGLGVTLATTEISTLLQLHKSFFPNKKVIDQRQELQQQELQQFPV